jgi:hypothetical protein
MKINGVTISGGGGGGATPIKLAAQTLASGSWVIGETYYEYTFSNANITTATTVDFTPGNASYAEISTCGMLTQIDEAAGSCKFYSLFPPQSNITGEMLITETT